MESESNAKVGLYPYIPLYKRFKLANDRHWYATWCSFPVDFIPKNGLEDRDKKGVDFWDGGYTEIPEKLDLFVFDGINYSTLKDRLRTFSPPSVPILENIKKYFLPHEKDNEEITAFPQFICAHFLFYREGDEELANAKTFTELLNALENEATGTGFLTTGVDNISWARYFLECIISETGKFPELEKGNEDYKVELIKKYSPKIKRLMEIVSKTIKNKRIFKKDMEQENLPQLLLRKEIRGYLGFAESLALLTKEKAKGLKVKLMPWSSEPGNKYAPFYVDYVGINKKVNRKVDSDILRWLTQVVAYNTLPDYLNGRLDEEGKKIFPGRPGIFKCIANFNIDIWGDFPPHVMPASEELFKELATRSDLFYDKIWAAIEGANKVPVVLSKDVDEWLKDKENGLDAVFGKIKSEISFCDPAPDKAEREEQRLIDIINGLNFVALRPSEMNTLLELMPAASQSKTYDSPVLEAASPQVKAPTMPATIPQMVLNALKDPAIVNEFIRIEVGKATGKISNWYSARFGY